MNHFKTLSYRIYTRDGNYTEAGRGEVTLEFAPGADGKTPINGVAMTMEGSSAQDPVLIPSGCERHWLGHQMHVRLRGDGSFVNSFIGQVRGTLRSNSDPIYFYGEYRHSGQPFEQLGPGRRYYYILAQQNDVEWNEDLGPRCDAEGNWSFGEESDVDTEDES